MKVIKTLDARSETRKALDEMKHELPQFLESIRLQSKMGRHQYDSLIKEGFTDAQAMQIVTTQPCWR